MWSASARAISSGVVVGRHQDDRDRPLPVDLRGGVDAVHVGHLDVGDDQVGLDVPALLDQLAAVLGHGDDLVAQAGQDLLEVVAHVGLVVGDGDPQRSGSWHVSRQGDAGSRAPGRPRRRRRSGPRGPRRSAWQLPCPGRSPWSWS